MSFVDSITPKDTEEVKPNLFIQKTRNGYRQIYPAAWNGNIIWKNFFFGGKFLKSTIVFILILFLVWSYNHDTKALRDFYNDRFDYCEDYIKWKQENQDFTDAVMEDLTYNLSWQEEFDEVRNSRILHNSS